MKIKLKLRKSMSHKGQNGIVLIIGGSEDYSGSPALVGLSALAVLRSGADLVFVAAPENVAWNINNFAPEIITRKVKCKNFNEKNISDVLKLTKNVDVVVIGNGLSLRKQTKDFIQNIVKKIKNPMIIDADALKVIKLQDVNNSVFTPHAKEWKALMKKSKVKNVKEAQKILKNNVLVLKGHPKTRIVTKNKILISSTGNASMTKGGVGDILAGLIAGLIAQGNNLLTSAYTAVHVNGKSGEALYKKKGFGWLASELCKQIPSELKKYQKYKER